MLEAPLICAIGTAAAFVWFSPLVSKIHLQQDMHTIVKVKCVSVDLQHYEAVSIDEGEHAFELAANTWGCKVYTQDKSASWCLWVSDPAEWTEWPDEKKKPRSPPRP